MDIIHYMVDIINTRDDMCYTVVVKSSLLMLLRFESGAQKYLFQNIK